MNSGWKLEALYKGVADWLALPLTIPITAIAFGKVGLLGHCEAEPILWRRKPRLSEGRCLYQGGKDSKW